MYIQDILNAGHSEYLSSLSNKNKNEKNADDSAFSPASWSKDTVSISDEARAAQQSAANGQNEGEDSEGEQDATAAFGEFMARAKGKVSSDPSEQLDALKNKLTQLQSKKSEVLSSEKLSEEAKASQAAGLDGQINQITAMIAQLESEMAKAAAGA